MWGRWLPPGQIHSNLPRRVADWGGIASSPTAGCGRRDSLGGASDCHSNRAPGRSSAIPITATVGALGVVYGDIGTSPLYALKEAARPPPMAVR